MSAAHLVFGIGLYWAGLYVRSRLNSGGNSFGESEYGDWGFVKPMARQHAVTAGLLLATVVLAGPPVRRAAGVTFPDPASLGLGFAAGLALYTLTELLSAVIPWLGLTYPDSGRSATAPSSPVAWIALVFVTLPLVSVVEELVFRGILIGVGAAAVDLRPGMLAVASSVVFGWMHKTGTGGQVVAGFLGVLLAVIFVHTGNLWTVVIAHTCVNTLEYLVHEAVGVDPAAPLKPG